MDLERAVIKRTIAYLLSRDLFISILICSHITLYFCSAISCKTAAIMTLGLLALIWAIYYTRLIGIVFKTKDNAYIKEAFKDEYFKIAKIRSGYNAFISMLISGLIMLAAGLVLDLYSISLPIPLYFICEIIILIGILTDDISKIVLSRG